MSSRGSSEASVALLTDVKCADIVLVAQRMCTRFMMRSLKSVYNGKLVLYSLLEAAGKFGSRRKSCERIVGFAYPFAGFRLLLAVRLLVLGLEVPWVYGSHSSLARLSLH